MTWCALLSRGHSDCYVDTGQQKRKTARRDDHVLVFSVIQVPWIRIAAIETIRSKVKRQEMDCKNSTVCTGRSGYCRINEEE